MISSAKCFRPSWRLGFLAFALLFALGSAVVADVIYKRDGSKVVGKITKEEKKRVQIEIRRGKLSAKIWVPRKEIFQIEKGLTPDEEFEERLSKLDPLDLAGHEALLAFAKKNKIREGASRIESLLPRIKVRRFKIDNARTWCRTCNATGSTHCEPCSGTGKQLEPCPRCDAKGAVACRVCQHRENGDLRCRRCGGEGKYERFDPKVGRKRLVECDDCKGAGLLACPTCKGERTLGCPVCKGKKGNPKKCETCQGSPKHTCVTCKGSKLQPKAVTDEQLAAEAKALAAKKAAEKSDGKTKAGEGASGDSKGDGQKPTSNPKAKPVGSTSSR